MTRKPYLNITRSHINELLKKEKIFCTAHKQITDEIRIEIIHYLKELIQNKIKEAKQNGKSHKTISNTNNLFDDSRRYNNALWNHEQSRTRNKSRW